MKKAIIITTSSEYSAYEEFDSAIKNRELCVYNSKNGLIKFLAARKEWEETRSSSQSNREAYRIFLNEECPDELQSEDIPGIAISKKMRTINLGKDYAPYSVFPSGKEWEVILVLIDCVNIERKECVNPVDVFLDCICEDLGLSETNGDYVLYVHAEQIGFSADGILVDEHVLRNEIGDNRALKWAKEHSNTFIRIAYFVHEHGTMKKNIFMRNILEKNFCGKTKIDETREMKKKFSDLNEEDI